MLILRKKPNRNLRNTAGKPVSTGVQPGFSDFSSVASGDRSPFSSDDEAHSCVRSTSSPRIQVGHLDTSRRFSFKYFQYSSFFFERESLNSTLFFLQFLYRRQKA